MATTNRRELVTAALGEDPIALMRRIRLETEPPTTPPGYRAFAEHIRQRTGISVHFTTLRDWDLEPETAA